MVRRWLIVAVAAGAVAGCGTEGLPVELDLCAPAGVTPSELSAMDNAESWRVVVFGMRDEDVSFERSFESDAGSTTLLSVGEAIPPRQEVRLLVRGFDTTPDGQARMVALASSPPLQVVGGEQVCLCVAPPETYDDVCYGVRCSYSPETGCTF